MATIDPQYDISTKTWFWVTGEETIEGATIRELLRNCRAKGMRDPKAKNYFPSGVDVRHQTVVPIVKPVSIGKPVVSAVTKPEVPKKPQVRTMGSRDTPEFINKVLDLWAAGVPGTEIAEQFGVTPAKVAANIVWRARRRGDPRAIVRNPRSIGVPR